MQAEFKLPELGENIESGNVVKVLVNVGDKVEKDQTVLELETDKATIEVPSSVSGIVRQVHVKEGGTASVGQVVLTVDSDAQPAAGKKAAPPAETAPTKETAKPAEPSKPSEPPKPAESPKPQPAAAKKPEEAKVSQATELQVKVPDMGEGIDSASVVNVLVREGDSISKDQPVLELETDKATFELPSDGTGVIRQIHVKEGDKVKVGQTVLTLSGQAAAAQPSTVAQESPSVMKKDEKVAEKQRSAVDEQDKPTTVAPPPGVEAEAPPSQPKQIAPAGPSVRKLAREIGVDINQVRGSGPRGRISIDDVKKFARGINQQRAGQPTGAPGVPALPDFSKWGAVERTPMSNVRLKTAQHLSVAWVSIPRVTQYDKADITELEEDRKRFSSKAEVAGGKLTVTAVLLKVVASALKTFPQFNSSVDMTRNEIVYKKYYHIGVAVDTERGLLVPVVRNVDKKNILQLSVDLSDLAEKARNKKLTLEEMQGGTFTITNLGGIGGTAFSPIVNYPEAAILGVSRASLEPVYQNGNFVPRLMLPLSLSYDHRVIDGADAARFLRWIAEAVKDPFLLALEG